MPYSTLRDTMAARFGRPAHSLAILGALLLGGTFAPESAHSASGHTHAHSAVHDGYFDDAQVKARALSDWEGEWQSVYPYLKSGALDPVMEAKAEKGDKTAAQYRAYYETGYKSEIDTIAISGNRVTFASTGGSASATYAADGHEVLVYAKGNRGVRYIFRKVEGDAGAPAFIQFSDHRIAPEKADHYHIYSGNDRAALLKEVTNWPTYYPAALTGLGIVKEMLSH